MQDAELVAFLARCGRVYRYLDQTTSSQDEARQLAAEGAPEGTLVVAERQTAGRGRQGRVWASRPGASLTFSLLLRPVLPPERLALVSFAAGVALRQACGAGGLKWPNDLLAPDRRKLAGVLVEAAFKPEGVVAVLGVGLNVRKFAGGAAALEEFSPKGRAEVLEGFLDAFGPLYRALAADPEPVLELWREHSYTLGSEVSVRTPGGEVRGRAASLARDGSLLVESADRTHRIAVGDVSLVGALEGGSA